MKSVKNQLALFLLITCSAVIYSQNIITIDNSPQSTTEHTTIQAAIDAAVDGDIIYVQPTATSYGTANVNKPLTIVGTSHSESGKISTLSTVNIKSSNVTLKGLNCSSLSINTTDTSPLPHTNVNLFENKFSNMQLGASSGDPKVDGLVIRGCLISAGITQYIDTKNILISNNIISGSGHNFYDPTQVVLLDNIFRFNSSLGITNSSTTQPLVISNSLFICNNGTNRTISFNGNEINLNNSLTYNYGAGDIILSGTGSLTVNNSLQNTNPLFTNVDSAVSNSMAGTSSYVNTKRLEDDLTLQAGSPALTLGVGGDEIGLFASGYRYQYLGNPNGVPTLEILSYDGAVAKDGNINVTIKAKAN